MPVAEPMPDSEPGPPQCRRPAAIVARWLALAAAAGLLAGCAATVPASGPAPAPTAADAPDAAPKAPPPGLALLPDPVVRPLPKAKRGNKPYTVWGQRYDVLPSAQDYDDVGLASWYGTKFDGRLTSSGEVYDMYKLTAAHRSLPIPTYVRVTNLDNGRSSVVRVNDRGPFHPDRIIDLSYAAAVKLGFEDQGTARVRVVAVVPEEEFPPVATATGPPFYVRAGRFADLSSAEALRADVRAVASESVFVVRRQQAYQVRIGPLATKREAERLRAILLFGEQGPVVVE